MIRGKRLSAAQRSALRLEIARLYCDEGKTLADVTHELARADGIEISTMEVSRILREAKDAGIVRFVFTPPESVDLGQRLVARYPCLRQAFVVAAGSSYSFQQRMLAQRAAQLFDDVVGQRGTCKIGISGGNTMAEMVGALETKRRDIDIYPTALIARGPDLPDHMDQMLIIGELWKKSGQMQQRAHYATLPPFDTGWSYRKVKDMYQGFLKWRKVGRVWEGMRSVDVIFASVGAVETPEEYKATRKRTILNLLEEMTIDLEWLRARGAVGDVSHSLFDANGQGLREGDFFITLGVDRMRAMARDADKSVVLVAGKYKEKALAAALTGGLCNILVTADETARELLTS